jgi:DNA primase
MPGIRFAEVRARVTMAEVLGLVGFVPCQTSGDQVRGPCPVHHSASPSGRSFSANLRSHISRCFKCGSSRNHLDLYAAATGRGLFEAAIELCERLDREIPWMLEGTSRQPRRVGGLTPAPLSGRKPEVQAGSNSGRR